MSMSSITGQWMWELLGYNCGVDEGRTAYSAERDLLVSIFKVINAKKKVIQIRTIMSGCVVKRPERKEFIVQKVISKRRQGKHLEYETKLAGYPVEWLPPSSFISDNGTVNQQWLNFAEDDDLLEAFMSFTHKKLQVSITFPFLSSLLIFTQLMCTAQEWKATGDKQTIAKRLVKRLRAVSVGRPAVIDLMESKIGPKSSAEGLPALVRKYYTDHYQALDRFDRLWYEMRWHNHPHEWQSHFCWGFIHSAIINARAVWCSAHGRRVPLREFIKNLIVCFSSSLPGD